MQGKIGKDVIEYYEPYRNEAADWKVTMLGKERFEVYSRY